MFSPFTGNSTTGKAGSSFVSSLVFRERKRGRLEKAGDVQCRQRLEGFSRRRDARAVFAAEESLRGPGTERARAKEGSQDSARWLRERPEQWRARGCGRGKPPP